MLQRTGWSLLAVLGLAACNAGIQASEMVDIRLRMVRSDGSPIVGLPVRVVLGSEKDARSPGTGERLVTDADGRIHRRVASQVGKRTVTLDNPFTPHRMDSIDVGVELQLLGRPALYWIELGSNRSGTLGGMAAYLPGRSGRFDQQIKRHPKFHYLWALPGDRNAPPLQGIGVELQHHSVDMTAAADGAQQWNVDLVLATQWEPKAGT